MQTKLLYMLESPALFLLKLLLQARWCFTNTERGGKDESKGGAAALTKELQVEPKQRSGSMGNVLIYMLMLSYQ